MYCIYVYIYIYVYTYIYIFKYTCHILQSIQELYRYFESICNIYFSIFLILCRSHAPVICKVYDHPWHFRSEFHPIATRRRRWGKDTDGSLKKWFSERLHRVGWPKFGSWNQSWVKKSLVNCLGKWMDIFLKGRLRCWQWLRVLSCQIEKGGEGAISCPLWCWAQIRHEMFEHSMTLRHSNVLTMRFYRRPPHACHSSLCSFLFIIMAYSLLLHGSVRTWATEHHEGLNILHKKNIEKQPLAENVAQYRPWSLQCRIVWFERQISNELHLILMSKHTFSSSRYFQLFFLAFGKMWCISVLFKNIKLQ